MTPFVAKIVAGLCIVTGILTLKEPTRPVNLTIGILYSVPYLLVAFYPTRRSYDMKAICLGMSLPMTALASWVVFLNLVFSRRVSPLVAAFIGFAVANLVLLICGLSVRVAADEKPRRTSMLLSFFGALTYPVWLTWILYDSRVFDRM